MTIKLVTKTIANVCHYCHAPALIQAFVGKRSESVCPNCVMNVVKEML